MSENDNPIISIAERKQEPDPQVVAELEKWLRLAKRGELCSVLIAGRCRYMEGPHKGEEMIRYGDAGSITHMDAASILEQRAFGIRAEVYAQKLRADEPGPVEGAEEPEEDTRRDYGHGWKLIKDPWQPSEWLEMEDPQGNEVTISRYGDARVKLYPPGEGSKSAYTSKTFTATKDLDDDDRCEKAAQWATKWLAENLESD